MEKKAEHNELGEKIIADKGWFKPFIEMCKEYYKSNPAGGNLHVVLDDGNLDGGAVLWCYGFACGSGGDELGKEIACYLSLMTEKQRKRVYNAYDMYANREYIGE